MDARYRIKMTPRASTLTPATDPIAAAMTVVLDSLDGGESGCSTDDGGGMVTMGGARGGLDAPNSHASSGPLFSAAGRQAGRQSAQVTAWKEKIG